MKVTVIRGNFFDDNCCNANTIIAITPNDMSVEEIMRRGIESCLFLKGDDKRVTNSNECRNFAEIHNCSPSIKVIAMPER